MKILRGLTLVFILNTGCLVNAQKMAESPEKHSLNPEAEVSLKNIEAIFQTLMDRGEEYTQDGLQRRIELLKTVNNEFDPETRQRLEFYREMEKFQNGIYHLDTTKVRGVEIKPQQLVALKLIENELRAFIEANQNEPWQDKINLKKAQNSMSALRSAITIFYGDNAGVFPLTPVELVPKYINGIPKLQTSCSSQPVNNINIVNGVETEDDLYRKIDDTGGWIYVGDKKSKMWGTIIVNCSHKDKKGTPIFKY